LSLSSWFDETVPELESDVWPSSSSSSLLLPSPLVAADGARGENSPAFPGADFFPSVGWARACCAES
jgi:hypothetical protein